MAGFQVSMHGRFWVSIEDRDSARLLASRSIDVRPGSKNGEKPDSAP